MEETESFSNFVSTKAALAKQDPGQKAVFGKNSSSVLEDILNESNIIVEEEDELTTFTQETL